MTTGTNLQLTYDEVNDSWSYQNVDYEYPSGSTNSWSGFTSPDPEFEFAPEEQQQEQDNSTVCPPGYIYDETLKQCLPDPNYIAPAYAGDPWAAKDKDDQPEPEFIEFDASTPEGRKSMYEHGREHDYFTTDTKKGGAYKFKGAPETGMVFPGLVPLAQFGEDAQYKRYINELVREDAKRKAAGQSPILAQAVGFFGLAKSFKNWGSYAMGAASSISQSAPSGWVGDPWKTDTTTGFQIPPDVRTQTSGISEETDKELDRLDRALRTEKLRQAENKTKESEIKVKKALSDLEDTYTKIEPKDRSEGGTGYTFTPKVDKPPVEQTTQSGVKYGAGRGGTKAVKSSPSKPTMTRPNPHTRSGFSY